MKLFRLQSCWFSIFFTLAAILAYSVSFIISISPISVHLVSAAVYIENSNGGSVSASTNGITISNGSPCTFASSDDNDAFAAAVVAATDCDNLSTETLRADPQHTHSTCNITYDRGNSVFAAALSGSDCTNFDVETNHLTLGREGNIFGSFFTIIYDFISQLSSQLLQISV
jgi:hypothetical protein